MFDIEYKGGNCIVVSSKKINIVVDPKLSVVGLKDANVKDAIELATESRFAINSDTAKLVIESPGEFGIGDFDIHGVAAQRHLDTEKDPKISTMYRIEIGDFHIAILGNIYEKLDDEELEDIGIVDVLVIPVGGGGYTLDPTGATKITRQIDPKIVIPVHYADPALKYEVPQLDVDAFIKELGAPVEETTKLKVKNASSLPASLTVYKVTRS